jgi:DNA-binding XRE family transcriptional regulator
MGFRRPADTGSNSGRLRCGGLAGGLSGRSLPRLGGGLSVMAGSLAVIGCSVKFAASNSLVYTIAMARGVPITEEEKETIAAALAKKPNASFVARKTGWSFATVWRVAKWASIELTAGRQAKGYKRLSAARRRKIAAALRADPRALQREIAQQTGVSRVTVSRIEGGVRRSRRLVPQVR